MAESKFLEWFKMAWKSVIGWYIEIVDVGEWMLKVAESKQCSRAVWLNGKVVEVVVRS